MTDREKNLLEDEDKRRKQLRLDFPVRGDWRDWENNYQKYGRILDREIRKQLGEFIDYSLSHFAKRDSLGSKNVYLLCALKLKCQNWEEVPWKEIIKEWRPILKRDGFDDPEVIDNFGGTGITLVFNVNFFGSKWNPKYTCFRVGNSFGINFFIYDNRSELSFLMGPLYNTRVLKLEKAIPKAVKATKWVIMRIQEEARKING